MRSFPLAALLHMARQLAQRRSRRRHRLLYDARMWAAGVSDNIKPLVHLSDFLMGIAPPAPTISCSGGRGRREAGGSTFQGLVGAAG